MAWSLIASAKGEGTPTGGTTGSVDTTGADFIVVSIGMFGPNSASITISDSKSNTYTALTKSPNNSSSGATRLYYCVSPTVGSGHTFTVAGANTYSSIAAAAFSGVNTSDALEAENSAAGASATTGQPGSITPAANGALIVYGGMAGGNGTYVSSVDTGTLLQATTGTSGQDYPTSISWYEQPTAGAINPTLTQNSASVWAAAVAAFNGAGGAGSQSITPGLYTDADTFHTPTVAPGAVSLAPALVTDADTFHAATVSQSGAAQELTPSLVTDADTFHAPTVAPGAVTLAPALVTDGDTFHAATVAAGAVSLAPALVADADTFHTPTVAPGAVTLAPALVTDGDTFHTATVTIDGGPQYLVPDLVTDADTFHAATVSPGAVSLTPNLYTDADTFHAAEVAAGYTLQPAAFADDDAFHAATVTQGGAVLQPALYVDADTFYAAVVSGGAPLLGTPGYSVTASSRTWRVERASTRTWRITS